MFRLSSLFHALPRKAACAAHTRALSTVTPSSSHLPFLSSPSSLSSIAHKKSSTVSPLKRAASASASSLSSSSSSTLSSLSSPPSFLTCLTSLPVPVSTPAAAIIPPRDVVVDGDNGSDDVLNCVARTYKPNVLKRKRKHGFLSRLRGGRNGLRTLLRRKLKGRHRLAA